MYCDQPYWLFVDICFTSRAVVSSIHNHLSIQAEAVFGYKLLVLSRVCSHGWRGAQKSTTAQIRLKLHYRHNSAAAQLLKGRCSAQLCWSRPHGFFILESLEVHGGIGFTSPAAPQLPDNERISIFAVTVALSVVRGQWSPSQELLHMFSISGDPATAAGFIHS